MAATFLLFLLSFQCLCFLFRFVGLLVSLFFFSKWERDDCVSCPAVIGPVMYFIFSLNFT